MNSSKTIVDGYLKRGDWRVKENSNSPFSYGGLTKYISGEVMKDYWLREVYTEDISQRYLSGDMHIHDLSSLTLYCCGYSLKNVIMMGIQGVSNIPTSSPAKHFDSILNQVANIITVYQNESAGAIAFSSFDTLLAPFIRKDNLSYTEVRQSMQNFIYSINSNSRCGAEPAFSNITIDLFPPKDLKDEYAIIGGELADFTYGECQPEMNMFNRAFCELMIKGDAKGRPFAYPIPTYNISKGFDWDNPNNDLLWEMAGKYGYPYFTNYINSDMNPEDARSMCPLHPNTEIVYMCVEGDNSEVRRGSISDAFRYINVNPKGCIKIPSNGKWIYCGINRFYIPSEYLITLEDGRHIQTTANHLNKIYSKNYIQSEDLRIGDCMSCWNEDTNTVEWVSIAAIEKVTNAPCVSYCVEVIDDVEPVFTLANGIVTHNCRLKLDLSELRKRNGGLFGSGDNTGSIGVVTVNLPRIAYKSRRNSDEFYKELNAVLDCAKDSLEIKRKWLQENVIDTRLIPAFCTYVGTLRNHFSTIGIVGMNEMCENFFGEGVGILTEQGKNFALEVGNHIREKLLEYQNETGNLYNFEATPAESTAYRLALRDKKEFPDIITRGTKKAPYYTNSCHIPVNQIKGLKETFDNQDDLQILFTGGTVIHIYCKAAITGETAKKIVKTVFENYRVPYISISPLNRYCPEHGYVVEAVDKCPRCGREVQKYQRITGYLRCVDDFNEGKTAEFDERIQLEFED